MILDKLFSARSEHPLADPKALKRVIAELPLDNTFKAVDEVSGWLESLHQGDDLRCDHFFDVLRQLDDAAQTHLRRLLREYLQSPRLSKTEERRLWSINHNYWSEVGTLYAHCLDRFSANPKDKGGEALKPFLPLVLARLVAARTAQLKWIEFRYGPVGEDLWGQLGRAYLTAAAAGYAQKPLQLYPHQPGTASIAQLYLHALVFYASSMDSLLPLEIELADRLIGHFLSGFEFSGTPQADSVYWVDPAKASPPARLARQPDELTANLRFFAPGKASQALGELIDKVERGDVPGDLNLGGQYAPRVLLPVLRHLALYWAQQPPLREHPRHAVKTRLAVLHGFDDCFTVFAGEVARLGKERQAESWVVENVSLGGFSAGIENLKVEWLKVGSLLSIQPEGGANWVLGVIRRFNRNRDDHATVGIQSLSRDAHSVELRPRVSGVAVLSQIPGIWLRDGNPPGETRLVMPVASFDPRESLEFNHGGQIYLLSPVELQEKSSSYEIARYRESVSS